MIVPARARSPRFSRIARLLFHASLISSLLAAAGCVYRPDVQQGNEITAEMISQVELGMTRREVIRILGYPLVNDPFNSNRWDYFYSYKPGRSKQAVTRQSAKLYFEGDYLNNIESDIVDESAPESEDDSTTASTGS